MHVAIHVGPTFASSYWQLQQNSTGNLHTNNVGNEYEFHTIRILLTILNGVGQHYEDRK